MIEYEHLVKLQVIKWNVYSINWTILQKKVKQNESLVKLQEYN